MAALRMNRLTILIAVLAVAGAAVSSYLTAVHLAGRPVYCAGLSSCETVNTSDYAELAGVPVALLGLGGYVAILALAVAGGRVAWAAPGLLFAATVGLLYSGYLTWVELAVLHAVCLWCVTSAVLIAAITVLATAQYLRGAAQPPPRQAGPAPRSAARRARRAL